MKTTSILSTLVVTLLLALSPAFAAEKTTKAPESSATPGKKEEAPKTDHVPLYGQVVSITPTTLTIKGGKDKPDRKFDITADTKITKDDKSATTKDAKEGQWVGGSFKKGEKGNTLLSLNLSAKQKEVRDDKKPEAAATTSSKKKKG